MKGYTIGQLAAAARVPISTVRFYERSGLVKPDFRTSANYRGYADPTLERLKFIRLAQGTGLSLDDIRSLLTLDLESEEPCEEVLMLMRKRHEEIRERIRQLRHIEKAIAKALNECCKGGPDICDSICRLKGSDPAKCRPSKKKCAKCT